MLSHSFSFYQRQRLAVWWLLAIREKQSSPDLLWFMSAIDRKALEHNNIRPASHRPAGPVIILRVRQRRLGNRRTTDVLLRLPDRNVKYFRDPGIYGIPDQLRNYSDFL